MKTDFSVAPVSVTHPSSALKVYLEGDLIRRPEGDFWTVKASFGFVYAEGTARKPRFATGLALRDLAEKLLKTGEQP